MDLLGAARRGTRGLRDDANLRAHSRSGARQFRRSLPRRLVRPGSWPNVWPNRHATSRNHGAGHGIRTHADHTHFAGLKRSRNADPRRNAHEVLAEIKVLALDSNDLALAQMVHRWEGELLGVMPVDGAEVIDLAERKRRE